jgi:prepilin-type N-terminal cleavage/methylation domain-containing protein
MIMRSGFTSSILNPPFHRVRKVWDSRTHPESLARKGFTLVELLVVIAIAGFFAITLVPALTASKLDTQKITCLNGKRQLCNAWRLFADDNSGKLVGNYHGAPVVGGAGGAISWVSGWLNWTTSPDNTNIEFLISDKYALLAPYVKGATNIFKCPADNYLSTVQVLRGWKQRVRSVSANIGIGEGNAAEGPWNSFYRHITKLSDFLYPSPAETYVFLDEHPDSMNEGAFFSPFQTSWVDLPAVYHYGAGAFGFADSHVEIHKWTGSLTNVRNYYGGFPGITVPPGDPDLHWMSYHAQRFSTISY